MGSRLKTKDDENEIDFRNNALSDSKLLVCFSKTNNPLPLSSSGWWIYYINGDIPNNNTWFDRPNIGISNNELYICGNMFGYNDVFNQAVCLQIVKNSGYTGQPLLTGQSWITITDGDGNLASGVFPASHGQAGGYGPGIYLVSNKSVGGNKVYLYRITDDMSASNEQFLSYVPGITISSYSIGANPDMSGTIDVLDPGDCRITSCFYLNGIIHFVFTVDIGSTWNGIHYDRLDIATLTDTWTMCGSPGVKDYCYSSIASYSTSLTDHSAMISFLASNNNIYPEVRVVNVDNTMNFSPSTLVRIGDTYANLTTWPAKERWGDYSSICRRHNSLTPNVWLEGSFGQNNTFGSNNWSGWVAEIGGFIPTGIDIGEEREIVCIFPNPVVAVIDVSFLVENNCEIEIELFDINYRLIKKLYDGTISKGESKLSFNKNALKSGVYFVSIKKNQEIIKTEKIVVIGEE